jgi:hypothetical protein
MYRPMKRLAFALVCALSTTSALADPLGDALEAGGGIVCFTRSYDDAWLKAHPGQGLREAKFMVTHRGADPWQVLRMSMKGDSSTLYLLGDCQWQDNINRDVQGGLLIPSFKPVSGVGCMLVTDVTGASAEEGGYFMVDWKDGGRAIDVHLDEEAAGWRSPAEADRAAGWVQLNPVDRVIRLERAEPSACADLAEFAEGQPQ